MLYETFKITENFDLTIIEINTLTKDLKLKIDEYFIRICEGPSPSDLETIKKRQRNRLKTQSETTIMGITAEFFIHLFLSIAGFKHESIFSNLEEGGSVKKGFDGYLSTGKIRWIMESKSGKNNFEKEQHAEKVDEAYTDVKTKVEGRSEKNPWMNALNHAFRTCSHDIIEDLQELADEYTNHTFHPIEDFNVIPCGTVFLGYADELPKPNMVKNSVSEKLKEKKNPKIHAICVTQRTVDLFRKYLDISGV